MIRPGDLDVTLERAFGLAFFLHGERETALQIVAAAMEKLEVAAVAQHKRLYYRPAARRRAAINAARNRISLSEPHLLQRLIFIESEPFERARERAGLEREGFLIHYLKHLVRITLKRNSFYVALGVSRLLFNYTTAEAMAIYQTLIQDPERVKDDYYYRSRKAALLQELRDRFGDRLRVRRAAHGEERFEPDEDQQGLAGLVEESLRFLTPWNIPCTVPARWDAFAEGVPALTSTPRRAEDEVEIHRIHTALHLDCFRRLTAALGLDSPDSRLQIPRFFNAGETSDGRRRSPPPLDAEGRQRIKGRLAELNERRRRTASPLLRVLVDGEERARFDAREASRARFEVGQGAELVEVRAYERGEEVLLASHLLGSPGRASARLANRGEITFVFQTSLDEAGEIAGGLLEVRLRPAGLPWFGRSGSLFRSRPARLLPGFAVLLLVLGAALAVLLLLREPSGQPAPISADRGADRAGSEASTNRQRVEPPPAPPPRETIAAHEPPRSPETGEEEDVLRSLPGPAAVESLAEVRQVCVETADDVPSGREIAGWLARRFAAEGPILLTENADEADACLKLAIVGSAPHLRVTVRMVNAEGRLLWPPADRAGRTYEGTAEQVAAALAGDLLADLDRYRGSP